MLRRALSIAGYVVALLAVTTLSALGHLSTVDGRGAVRDIANRVLSQLFRGRLTVGSVDLLGLTRGLRASRLTLDDAHGRRIIDDATLEAGSLAQLARAVLGRPDSAMPALELRVRSLELVFDESGAPTIAGAFESPARDTSAQPRAPRAHERERAPMNLRFPSMRVRVERVNLAHPAAPVRIDDASVQGSMQTEPFSLRAALDRARVDAQRYGRATASGDFSLTLPPWSPREHDADAERHEQAPFEGRLHAGARLRGEELDCDVSLDVDREGTRLDVRACVARAPLLARIAGAPLLADVHIRSARLARGPGGALRVDLDASIAESPVVARLDLHGTRAEGTLDLQGLDLARIQGTLPHSNLRGRLRVTRDGDALTLDGTALEARVDGRLIPSVRARARTSAASLELEAVEVPELGLLARGRVHTGERAGELELELEGNVPDARRVELLRDLGVAGGARYRARVARRSGRTEVEFDVSARGLAVPGGVRLASGSARGSLTVERDGAIALRAEGRGAGVRVAGFGPIDGAVHVEGDPRRSLRGRVRASGDHVAALPGEPERGPTWVEGSFEIDRSERETRVRVPRARVSLRGATATVTAAVRAPAGGRPTVDAEVTTQDGGRARLRVDPSGISTDLGAMSTEWVARALGFERGLGGIVEGDLRMVAGHPRGSLRWSGGALPVLGPVTVALDARGEGGRDRLSGALEYGSGSPRSRLELDARLDARSATRGGLDGLLRSIDAIELRARRTPAALLAQLGYPGTQFAGSADAALRATRERPGAPLEAVLGFDVRRFVPSANVRAAVTGAIFGRRGAAPTASRGMRALTVPLRLRGALCATVSTTRAYPERARTALAWGADGNQPEREVPTACTGTEADFQPALLRAEGETGGPWHAALTGVVRAILAARGSGKRWADLRFEPALLSALRAATVSLDLHVGPAAPADWPFTAAAARLIPALVRPPVEGTFASAVHIAGALRAPSIRAEVHATSDAPAWLNVHDRASFDAELSIATARDGETVLDHASVDVDATAALRRREGVDASATRATLQLRTVVDPRALFDGREGLRSIDIERAELRSNSLDLSRLAWARANRVEGRASLTLSDTGERGRPFLLNATINDLRVRNQSASSVALRVGLFDGCATERARSAACAERDWQLRSCVAWAPGSQGTAGCDPVARNEYAPQEGLRLTASVPFEGDWHELRVRESEAQVILNALSFPLERIAPIVERPPIVHLGGALTSSLRWQARDPRAFAGYFVVSRGELTIERMGVPIRDIELSVMAQARQLRFSPPMTMHMGSGATQGTLTASGFIDFSAQRGELARVRIFPRVESFPAVQEGNLFAIITGSLAFDAYLYANRMQGTLTIQQANVQVPEESSRSLQTLDEAPGVFVLGRSRVAAPSQNRGFTADIDFRTAEPIFLRRRDFLIGVTTEGGLRYDNAIYLRGAVSQFGRQNFFELFGKRFYFDRVSVLFDGSSSLDPLLDVALHYDSPTDGRISITVTGHKNSPEIRFSAERYPGASEAEILAMLVLGRRESRGASDQATLEQQGRQAAASLLTAVLYGFGAGQVQRALESTGVGFVPTVIAEPGADGTALSRLGIGVLPSFLGNRVYIEGTYNNSQATGQGAQLLIDATINDHFSLGGVLGTSSNNGQRFGVDFFYTP